uniref:IBR domain-containing protein n=1 Tax=Globodera pallida TaxID=36090 RepID=A0A183BU41_GLOPA
MGESFNEGSQLIETEIDENSQAQDETSTLKQPEVQYDERDSIMRAFGAMEKATRARQCPRCLNIYAQKIGCNYVRCPNLRCNTWFVGSAGRGRDCKPSFDDVAERTVLVKFVLFIGGFTLVIETKNDKQTIQKELNLALSTALGLMKRSEEHFDLDKLKSVSVGIRQKNITKTISDAMKTIEKEINEKKRQ